MFRPYMIRQFFNLVCALFILLPALPIPASSLSIDNEIGPIDEILSTDIPSVTRSTWNPSGAWRCHESFVEQPGWVMLDISTPAGSPVPRLEVLDSLPGIDSEGATYSFSSRSISGGLLAIQQPGYLYACVRAWDPSQELGAYKLSSRFLASDLARQDRFLSASVMEDPEEDEPDLDPLTGSSCDPSRQPHRKMPTPASNGQMGGQTIQVEDPEEDEPDLDPFTGTDSEQEQSPIARLCRTDEDDDHGDFAPCGTAIELGGVTTGQIHNDWGDDQDTFRFKLLRTTAVQLRLVADFAYRLDLFDARGLHLNLDLLDGSDGYRASVLPPGTYIVQLKGLHNEEGSYALGLERLVP